ncbi:hypothetical protein MalM25_25280 [Planctomycetes bacterium MalM25]|nr:hypothetical protein MalM25_25280 [Planctomycetes bacterium MalM25]
MSFTSMISIGLCLFFVWLLIAAAKKKKGGDD